MGSEKKSPEQTGFRELYKKFRGGKLGVIDSAYNALYIYLSDKADKKRTRLKKGFENIGNHPAGWFSDKREYHRPSEYDSAIGIIELLPKIKKAKKTKKSGTVQNGVGFISAAAGFVKNNFAYIAPAVCAVITASVIASYLPVNIDIVASVNGEEIGFVDSKASVDGVVSELETKVSDLLGCAFKYPAAITYEFGNRSGSYVSLADIRSAVSKYTGDYIRTGYGVYIDGTLVAVNEDKAVLENAVAASLEVEQNCNPGARVSFDGPVTYAHETYPASLFMDGESIYKLLSSAAAGVDFPDADGAMSGTISVSKKTGVDSVYYRDVETDEKVETVKYKVVTPITYTEPIPFDTVTIEDGDLYVGKTYVSQEGADGMMQILASVTYVGTAQTDKVITGKHIITDKTDKIIVVGTKPYPEDNESLGKKQFMCPLEYFHVNSRFGWRDLNGDGYYENHGGVDLKAAVGTEVYAAMSGKVVFAGAYDRSSSLGSYGKLIRILHPNGMYTFYAHLSEILVKEGDEVHQGDLIALSGRTGNVTGPHLHFEIRDAEMTRLNPLLYLYIEDKQRI